MGSPAAAGLLEFHLIARVVAAWLTPLKRGDDAGVSEAGLDSKVVFLVVPISRKKLDLNPPDS